MAEHSTKLDKRSIGDMLGRLAFAAELTGDASLNAQGLSAAAWTLRAIDGDLVELVKNGELAKRRDLVKDAVRAITEFVESGRVEALARLEGEIPSGLFDVRKVKGLGPKKVRALWKDLGITSLGELEYACNENRLVELKGFGKKTQENVRQAIAEVRQREGRHRLDRALALAAPVVDALRAAGQVAHVAGAARRNLDIVDDVVVVTTGSAEAIDAALAAFAPSSSEDADDAATSDRAEKRVAGVRIAPAPDGESFATHLLFETGSEAHLALLVEHARARGCVLGRAGLTKDGAPVSISGDDDEGVYRALGLLPTEPERREAGVPLVLEGQARPRLVELTDLLGALHNHTTASDGTASLDEMRRAAAARGLRYLAITEHSETAAYAGGLSRERIAAQRAEIAKLNADGACPCVLVCGIESDILKDGALDYDDETLASLDVVVASVHQRYGLDGDESTSRLARAARHPAADVIGHPTGRLILGRKGVEIDIDRFLLACREARTVVELNGNPARLDLSDVHLARAKEHGVLVSISADAHSTDALDHLRFGVMVARRAGLTADDVLNTRPLDEVQRTLAERRAHRRALPA